MGAELWVSLIKQRRAGAIETGGTGAHGQNGMENEMTRSVGYQARVSIDPEMKGENKISDDVEKADRSQRPELPGITKGGVEFLFCERQRWVVLFFPLLFLFSILTNVTGAHHSERDEAAWTAQWLSRDL